MDFAVPTGIAVVGLILLAVFAAAQSSAPPAPVPQTRPVPAPARFVVVLDAAHGGEDGGGQIGPATAEKTVTLALSVRLRSLLNARGIQVVTTREGNVNLDSDARAQIANHAQAAACIVLHATESGSGVHLFTSSLAPTQPTRFLAWKTAQSAYIPRSLRLAGALNSAIEKSSDGGTAVPATLARAALPGLDSLACPAVVVEVAPMRENDGSVTDDVTDPGYQSQIADALAAALLEWKTDWETDPVQTGRGRQP